MDMDLRSYVRIYSNWIEKQNRDTAIQDLQAASWQKHSFYQPKTNTNVALSDDNELYFTYDLSSETPYMMKRIWDAYYKYLLEDLKLPWFSGWSGYSNVRFNRYSANQQMALHCDHIVSLFEGTKRGIPVLTALGILNDDYEGGEFIMWEDDLKLKAGDMIIFPSIFLYPHKVNPVTKGERYSFVSWAW